MYETFQRSLYNNLLKRFSGLYIGMNTKTCASDCMLGPTPRGLGVGLLLTAAHTCGFSPTISDFSDTAGVTGCMVLQTTQLPSPHFSTNAVTQNAMDTCHLLGSVACVTNSHARTAMKSRESPRKKLMRMFAIQTRLKPSSSLKLTRNPARVGFPS